MFDRPECGCTLAAIGDERFPKPEAPTTVLVSIRWIRCTGWGSKFSRAGRSDTSPNGHLVPGRGAAQEVQCDSRSWRRRCQPWPCVHLRPPRYLRHRRLHPVAGRLRSQHLSRHQLPHHQLPHHPLHPRHLPPRHLPHRQHPHHQHPHHQLSRHQLPHHQLPHHQLPHHHLPPRQHPPHQLPHHQLHPRHPRHHQHPHRHPPPHQRLPPSRPRPGRRPGGFCSGATPC